MSVVVLRQVLGLMVQNTVVRPQLLFIGGRLPSFVPQRQIPMVQTVQQTTEIPQMPFVFRWSMPLLCRSCGSQVVYLRTQRTAWFDSGYMRCVSLRSFHIFYVYWLTMDLEVDSRPALFWRLLGSTVDTSLCVRLRRPYFSVMLGSTVDTSLCVRLRRLVFLVTIHLALCSFPVFRPVMLDIMASMDLKDSFMRGAAHHRGHVHSLRGAEFGSHGPHCLQTMRFHDCSSSTWINMPVVESHMCLGWFRQCSFCGVPQLALSWTG